MSRNCARSFRYSAFPRPRAQFQSPMLNAYRARWYSTEPRNEEDRKKSEPSFTANNVPGGSGGGDGKKPPESESSKLSKEELEQLDRVGERLKATVPESRRHMVDEFITFVKREGYPPEIRDVFKEIDTKGDFTMASAAKFLKYMTKRSWDTAKSDADRMTGRSEEPKESKEESKNKKEDKSRQQRRTQQNPQFKAFEFKFDLGNFLIAAFLSYYIYRSFFPGESSRDITWQEFRTTFFDKGLVDKLTVVNRSRVRVELHREAVASMYPESPASRPHFHYYFTIGSVEAFERKLDEAQNELGIPPPERIPVAYVDEVPWASTLISFGPTLLLIGSFFWLSRRAAGGAGGQSGIFGIGKSRAKRFNHETDIKTKFSDVAGMDEAKTEIMEFVSYLKKPEQFQRLGAKIPRGAILSGPPGTGKTLLAKATAGESEVPFYSVSGSEFVEMFVGVGPSRVRDLFATARKNTPCILFIDEIDAIGKSRAKQGFGGGNDERESTLNQILTEMDGFNTSDQVVVLAGTNRADVLDKALMRPGRFDRHITIDRPTMDGRKQIFRVHLSKVVTHENMDYLTGRLAALTPGFSGADIGNCVNEAALVGK